MLSLLYVPTLTSICDYWKTKALTMDVCYKVMSLLFNILSRIVIVFLPRSKHLFLCHPLLLPPSIFPNIRVFSNESALHIRQPKYWNFSFNISPLKEHSGLISFRMDWLALLASKDSQESFPIPQFKSINSSMLSFLYSPILISIHDYWKNHSFD